MPVIVNKLGEHRNEEAVDNLINYMSMSPYAMCSGGRGIASSSPAQVLADFMFVKDMYNKNDRKRISHIIIGTQEKEYMIEPELFRIAEYISEYLYENGYQSYFVIHRGSYEKPCYLHIHLAINTINYKDGTRYYETYGNASALKNALQSVFNQYEWFLINDTSLSWEE